LVNTLLRDRDEGSLGSNGFSKGRGCKPKIEFGQFVAERPPSGRFLANPFICAPVLLAILFAPGPPAAHAQQPMNPTPQAPPSSSSTQPFQVPGSQNPKKEEKDQSTVPPGSVLPEYSTVQAKPPQSAQPVPTSESLRGWTGLTVVDIRFNGVARTDLEPLPEQLEQQPNTPLDPVKVRESLRRLYTTGLFQTIAVDGEKQGDGVILTFTGTPTLFIGRVLVRGVKNNQLSNQLSYSTHLNPGTPFTQQKIDRATALLQETLQENGYYQASIVHHTKIDRVHSEEDVQFNVKTGLAARVGDVAVKGNSGMTLPDFRQRAKLKPDSKVNRDTVSRALARIRKNYQKQQRLEPNVTLTSKQYERPVNHLNLNFQADRGPVVRVIVEGASLSKGKIKSLVPIFAEGTLDEDLLNSGSKRIRDYFQRIGYIDAKVTYISDTSNDLTRVTYDVTLGARVRLQSVAITGNRYFGDWTIRQRLGVQPASLLVPHGNYSLALQTADVNAITALYQSNGFTNVKITPEIRDLGDNPKTHERNLAVAYRIEEGVQQKVGAYKIDGVSPDQLKDLQAKLSLQSGEPYSGNNLASDRDAIVSYYLDHGYDHAKVTVLQAPSPSDPNLIDVHLNVVPGDQIFIRNVIISGLHYTRPGTVKHQILVVPGQPLDQAKLLESQRRLYGLTLFNQVNTAVENPDGNEPRKNVLVQFDEARRWDVVYGAGLQAQTGTPTTNCPNAVSLIQLGINPNNYSCSPNGHFGASALVELDVSRINLFGRNQTVTFRSEYGTLEQQITAQYTTPRFLNHPTLDFSSDVGYINAQNVVTFASSTEEGDIRVTHHPDRINTLIYQLSYRRVKVDPNTIQVAPNLIPLLSEPVRVGGPELTWIRDTRRPEPLDAQSGMYNSIQEFASDNHFLTSQANFNHFDWTNSTYYTIGKHRNVVLARNTRFGIERVFGEAKFESIPLPERLYAGGPESLRGFALNSAGPRDSLTGFPIGGAATFVNQTELRLPNPQLPWFGKSLGFVFFHDMGNVFNNSSDIWPAAIRIKQPHSYTCTAAQYLNAATQEKVSRSSSTNTTGTCDFNDFSHSVGIGARYHTPIGPIRFDMGYNLNPPVYPVIVTYGVPGAEGVTCYPNQPTECYSRANHFNFFFSIGQAF
jgi:outer membrane protein insertion porin family